MTKYRNRDNGSSSDKHRDAFGAGAFSGGASGEVLQTFGPPTAADVEYSGPRVLQWMSLPSNKVCVVRLAPFCMSARLGSHWFGAAGVGMPCRAGCVQCAAGYRRDYRTYLAGNAGTLPESSTGWEPCVVSLPDRLCAQVVLLLADACIMQNEASAISFVRRGKLVSAVCASSMVQQPAAGAFLDLSATMSRLWSSKVIIELMLPVNVCPRGERDHDQEDDNATETA